MGIDNWQFMERMQVDISAIANPFPHACCLKWGLYIILWHCALKCDMYLLKHLAPKLTESDLLPQRFITWLILCNQFSSWTFSAHTMSELKCKIYQSNYVFKNESKLDNQMAKSIVMQSLRGCTSPRWGISKGNARNCQV